MPGRQFPSPFVRNVTGAFAHGAAWLDQLPDLVAACCHQWNLSWPGDSFNLTFNYVVPVLRHGEIPAVLKLGVPGPEFVAEGRALRCFHGHGAVELLESDESLGALLLARIHPGNTLATLNDENDEIQATEIAARTMLQLWKAEADGTHFRSLESWTFGLAKLRPHFSGGTGPLDAGLVDMAENLRIELLQDAQPSRLLHADLHHFNILYGAGSGWIAIDPKGVIGDPSYETAAFLLNPSPAVVLNRSTQQARISVLADHLNMDAQRMVRWTFFHAVLSAWWSIEDGGNDWGSSLAAARVLSSLLV